MAALTEDKILKLVREDIDAAQAVNDIEAIDNAKNYKYFRAKTMDNEVAGRSQIISTDILETIEWALPALMDIFDVNNGVPEFEPVGPEDEDPARAMTRLVQYQFWRLNDGETVLRQAIKDALLYRPGGIIKYCWEKEVSKEPKSYEGLTGQELSWIANNPDYTLTGATETAYGYDVEAEFKVVQFDGPRIYIVPPWEFLRHPKATSVKESPFIGHKKKVTVDYLRRMEKAGLFKNVKKAIGEGANPEGPDYTEQVIDLTDGQQRGEEPSGDEARGEVDLYECYVKLDVDDDGLLENRIICIVGNTIVRNVENIYKEPPFVCLRGIEDTHKFAGITLAELVADLQRLNTFMLRQTVDNLAQSNNTRKVYDPTRINHADLLNNTPGAPIRTTRPGVDVRTALVELPTEPIQPTVMSFFGIAKEMGEQRTGIGKSFRGVADASNQTASGQYQLINQASQRIRMMAKILGAGLGDLFRAFVFMNKKMLNTETIVRFEGRPILITPDDLEGKMDMVLNIFLGAASRQQDIVNNQQLLAILGQLKQFGFPILDAANAAHIVKDTARAMGKKNPELYLPMMFRQRPEIANQLMRIDEMQRMLMEGGMGGAGGQTMGSLAGDGGGNSSTSNPTGAGIGTGATEPFSGSVAPGFQ